MLPRIKIVALGEDSAEKLAIWFIPPELDQVVLGLLPACYASFVKPLIRLVRGSNMHVHCHASKTSRVGGLG